jgi:hypothetical protein
VKEGVTTRSVPVAVNRDGKLVSRVNQKVDTKQEATEGATPATRVRTEVEVPSQGIHRTMDSDLQQAVSNVERRNNVRNTKHGLGSVLRHEITRLQYRGSHK